MSGANPRPPPGASTSGGGGTRITVVLSRCGTPPVPACTTHTVVSTGTDVDAGSMKATAHDTILVDTAVSWPQDTLAAGGCSPAGRR